MTGRIFRATFFVAAIMLICSLGIIMGVLYDYFDDVQTAQLHDELRIAAAGVELDGENFLEALNAENYRITWVLPDGSVCYDTHTDAAAMENHGDREEVRQAFDTGTGSGTRYSDTLLERTVYEAVRLSDGSVLRISMDEQTMLILIVGMLHPVVVVLVIAIILCAVLAGRMSKRIVEPLNTLDLEHPLENNAYAEIQPLLRRINQQHIQIKDQMKKLKRKTSEFEQITGSMQEGLVLLDSDAGILSINPTAKKLFGTEGSCAGKNFLTMDRSTPIRDAVNAALDYGTGTAQLQRSGREYQLDVSRIESDGKTIGAVVLILDVTEAISAERTRREFSANVSHELKTPLQTIIGSAELLENGLVKPEDTPRFVGHIRQEASRLLNLIEDIIRLSQLDEGNGLPVEEVELLALAQEAASVLADAASRKDVKVTVTGQSAAVSGVRRLLYEVIYNLCDNAIKYNIAGGSVSVDVTQQDGHVILMVSDTGIGIPPEHQSRVFERFYRVDKSHSKRSGGTGLGLSIVKHGVQYHNARLELQSTPGEGTTVTVIF